MSRRFTLRDVTPSVFQFAIYRLPMNYRGDAGGFWWDMRPQAIRQQTSRNLGESFVGAKWLGKQIQPLPVAGPVASSRLFPYVPEVFQMLFYQRYLN